MVARSLPDRKVDVDVDKGGNGRPEVRELCPSLKLRRELPGMEGPVSEGMEGRDQVGGMSCQGKVPSREGLGAA